MEAAFELVPGVVNITSGYTGGLTENPKYEQVLTGKTGHAETVEIEYDPVAVSFSKLLDLFFKVHDPGQKNRQGNDIGNQYRSAIFYTNDEQKKAAEKAIEKLKNLGSYLDIYTEISLFTKFWPAEAYHQNYFKKHPEQAYCQAIIRPKVDKFKIF